MEVRWGTSHQYVKLRKKEQWGLATTRLAWLCLPNKQAPNTWRKGVTRQNYIWPWVNWIGIDIPFHSCLLFTNILFYVKTWFLLFKQLQLFHQISGFKNTHTNNPTQQLTGTLSIGTKINYGKFKNNSKMNWYLQQKFLSNKEVLNDSDRHENCKRNKASVLCTVLTSGYPSQAPIFASFDAMWAARHLRHLRKGSRNPSWWYEVMNLQNLIYTI